MLSSSRSFTLSVLGGRHTAPLSFDGSAPLLPPNDGLFRKEMDGRIEGRFVEIPFVEMNASLFFAIVSRFIPAEGGGEGGGASNSLRRDSNMALSSFTSGSFG